MHDHDHFPLPESNPFLPEGQMVGAITANQLSLLHLGSMLVSDAENRETVSKMTWASLRSGETALTRLGAAPDQANRAVAYETAIAIAQWCGLYQIGYDPTQAPPSSSVDGYLAHAMQDHRMEAVAVLDWADQLPGVEELRSARSTRLTRFAGVTSQAPKPDEPEWELRPRRGAVAASLVLVMRLTENRLGVLDNDSHRGHGCPLDPEREA